MDQPPPFGGFDQMMAEIEPKTEMFTIWPDDVNGDQEEYEQLLQKLYDQDSRYVELPDHPPKSTWTQDGAFRTFVTYGLLPENEEDEDEPDPDYEDF